MYSSSWPSFSSSLPDVTVQNEPLLTASPAVDSVFEGEDQDSAAAQLLSLHLSKSVIRPCYQQDFSSVFGSSTSSWNNGFLNMDEINICNPQVGLKEGNQDADRPPAISSLLNKQKANMYSSSWPSSSLSPLDATFQKNPLLKASTVVDLVFAGESHGPAAAHLPSLPLPPSTSSRCFLQHSPSFVFGPCNSSCNNGFLDMDDTNICNTLVGWNNQDSGTGFSPADYIIPSLESVTPEFNRLDFFPQASDEDRSPIQSFSPSSFEINFKEKSNSISFSTPASKPASISSVGQDEEILDSHYRKLLEMQTSLSHTTFETARAQKQWDFSEYSSFCNVRTRNGFGPNPRSIAERERRKRITEKLKQLEELVPNTGKHMSYAELLDGTAKHIESLGQKLQKLQKALAHCKCKRERESLNH